MNQINHLSAGDRAGILGRGDTGTMSKFKYSDTWRSCVSAFRILRQNRGRIKRLAKCLVEAQTKAEHEAAEQKWAGVPRPSIFPATQAAFVEAVCGGTERFEQFIVHMAKAQLTNGRPVNFDDAKQSLVTHFRQNVTDELRALHKGKSADEIAEALFAAEFSRALDFQRTLYADFKSESAWLTAARAYQQWQATEKP